MTTDDQVMERAWRNLMGDLPMEGSEFETWRVGWQSARDHYEGTESGLQVDHLEVDFKLTRLV